MQSSSGPSIGLLKEVRLISYLLFWENLRSGVGQSLENLDFKKTFDYMMSLICGV